MPSAIPCSLSPLLSRVHSCLSSDWRRAVSSKFFDTQVSSISIEGLVLSRLRCNGHSVLLSSYFSRIGKFENSSCSACGHSSQDNFYLILYCPASDSLRRLLVGDSLSFYDLWSRPWGFMVFRHAIIPRKEPGNNNNNNNMQCTRFCVKLFENS